MSYKPHNEPEDFMFVSENAYFQSGKAIKGGVPICWPWFGADPDNPNNPDHGFARNNPWTVSSTNKLQNGDTRIKLVLTDTAETRKIWPHSFHLSLEITVGDTLTLALLTKNTGQDTFYITEALHTYFNIGDATQIELLGLEHTEYLDKTENFVKVCQVGAITLSEETDHIHTDITHDLTIIDPSFHRKIKIASSGNKNVVVWNPWAKGSSQISDLDEDDYKHFVCVEIANAASDKVEIPAGTEYIMTTSYSCIKLN